jgi:N-acetyl-gamma-glutamyl-phosphate reductase
MILKIGIVGANGYGGVELIRWLSGHPQAEIEMLVSHATSGQSIQTLYPHLVGRCEMPLEALDIDAAASRVALMFFATPAGVSRTLVPQFLERGIRCIDLSGDFRLKDPQTYEDWYGQKPADPAFLERAVYGLSEINGENIRDADLIANPGCYPTAALLGLIPALQNGLIAPNSVIIDAKSGLSGAGRKTSLPHLFSEANESVRAYKLGAHQHIPEIEQALEAFTGQKVRITFTPHIVPMTRGILATIYADLQAEVTTEAVAALYREYYASKPFVRICDPGHVPATKEVYGSNYCAIGLNADSRTGRLTIVSVIDNLVKGAAGQAVQNMNLLFGWEESAGLSALPVYP